MSKVKTLEDKLVILGNGLKSDKDVIDEIIKVVRSLVRKSLRVNSNNPYALGMREVIEDNLKSRGLL